MHGYRCKVTGSTSTKKLAKAQTPTRCVAYGPDVVNGDGPCVKGAKSMIAWRQASGNNYPEDKWAIKYTNNTFIWYPAGYNMGLGFADGAQNDIFLSGGTSNNAGSNSGTSNSGGSNSGTNNSGTSNSGGSNSNSGSEKSPAPISEASSAVQSTSAPASAPTSASSQVQAAGGSTIAAASAQASNVMTMTSLTGGALPQTTPYSSVVAADVGTTTKPSKKTQSKCKATSTSKTTTEAIVTITETATKTIYACPSSHKA